MNDMSDEEYYEGIFGRKATEEESAAYNVGYSAGYATCLKDIYPYVKPMQVAVRNAMVEIHPIDPPKGEKS